MRVYLDDERDPKSGGWIVVRTVRECCKLLETGKVTELSLDHDLGLDGDGNERASGYHVLQWLEYAVAVDGFKPPAIINVHSANPSVQIKMNQAIDSIKRLSIQNEERANRKAP